MMLRLSKSSTRSIRSKHALSESEWLAGDRFTEADLRLFPTLARFDVAYHYAFKCNIRRLVDYPNLWRYARRIYAMPGVASTVNFDIYKRGYFSPFRAAKSARNCSGRPGGRLVTLICKAYRSGNRA